MSFEVTTACRPLRLPQAQKSVLMCLADYCHPSGKDWHSIAAIMEWTCLGKTAVIEALKGLEAAGLIKRQARPNPLPSLTFLQLDVIAAMVEAQADQSGRRTSPPAEPVRDADQTSPLGAPVPVRLANQPVREADPKHQEASEKHQKAGRGAKRCPPSFEVTPELKALAEGECPGVDIDFETAKFRDHQFDRAHTDWPAAWRNWMRRAFQFGAQRAARGSKAEPAWRTDQRNRSAAFAGPAAARRIRTFNADDYTEVIPQ